MEVEADVSTIASISANIWTFTNEKRLISILIQLKEREKDGSNFTVAVWDQVAEELNKYHT